MNSWQITRFGGPLELTCTADPEPGGAAVLVRVEGCGMCHSDLHIWSGFFDLGGGKRYEVKNRMTLPFTLGHEIVGEVIAAGPDATVAVGTKGIVFPWIGCGSCHACRAGQELRCPAPRVLGTRKDGGYSDRVLVPDGRYIVPYGDMDPALAATCACSGLTAYSAIRKLPPLGPDGSVLILGAGGVGLAGVGLARAMLPGVKVVVTDPAGPKREAALAAGADAALDPAAPDIAKLVRAETGRAPLAAIDFVGAPDTLRLALDSVDVGGTVVAVGLFGGEITLSTALVPLRQVTLRGSYVGTLDELRELVALMNEQEMASVPVSTRPMAEVNAIVSELEAGRVVGRVVMVP